MRYKRAALKDHLGKITGTSAGALAGGLGGYGLAGLFSDNKSIKILAALAGAVGGGYGGYRLGNYMDTQRAGLQTDLSNANTLNARLNEQNAIQEGLILGWKANDQEQKNIIAGQLNTIKNQEILKKLLTSKLIFAEKLKLRAYADAELQKAIADAATKNLAKARMKNKEVAALLRRYRTIKDNYDRFTTPDVQRRVYGIPGQ